MKTVIAWLKGLQVDRVLTAFLVGLLLFVSTACSSGASAKTADEVQKEVPSSAVTNEYKGGMNDYSDVDPRLDTKQAQAKAKALVENAQKNIDQKSVDSGEQYVENYQSGTSVGERARRIGENIGESAKELTEGAAKGTQRGVQNLKENTQDAAKDVAQKSKETAEKVGDAAQSKVKSDIDTTQRALDKAQDSSENFGDKVKQAVKSIIE